MSVISINQKIKAAKERVEAAGIPLNKRLWNQVKPILDKCEVSYKNKPYSGYLESVSVPLVVSKTGLSTKELDALSKAMKALERVFRRYDEVEVVTQTEKAGLVLTVVAYSEADEKPYVEDDGL